MQRSPCIPKVYPANHAASIGGLWKGFYFANLPASSAFCFACCAFETS